MKTKSTTLSSLSFGSYFKITLKSERIYKYLGISSANFYSCLCKVVAKSPYDRQFMVNEKVFFDKSQKVYQVSI